METKRCTKCGAEKPLSAFYKRKASKDGLTYKCKSCIKAYKQSPNGVAAQKRYLGSDKFKEAQAKYNNTEKGKETKVRRDARYRSSEKGKEAQRKAIHTRRARLKDAEVQSFTEEDLKAFWLSQNILYDECYYCGKDMNGKYEHLDHYIPIAKGGDHTMVNLRPSCACCNQKKSDKMPTDFPSQR